MMKECIESYEKPLHIEFFSMIIVLIVMIIYKLLNVCNVSAGHPSKRWPRSTLLNFGTKSGESTTSLEKLAP